MLCIMGPSRSGKSFFLNFTRLYLDCLESRSSLHVMIPRRWYCGYYTEHIGHTAVDDLRGRTYPRV